MKGSVILAIAITVATCSPGSVQAQGLSQGSFITGGSNESTKPSYICFREIGQFYKVLGELYAIRQSKEGYYLGTQRDIDRWNDISWRGELRARYNDAKAACKGDQLQYMPQRVFEPYLRGFNFKTGETR
jgi:hypothetical protein